MKELIEYLLSLMAQRTQVQRLIESNGVYGLGLMTEDGGVKYPLIFDMTSSRYGQELRQLRNYIADGIFAYRDKLDSKIKAKAAEIVNYGG